MLKKIYVSQAYHSEHQIHLVRNAENIIRRKKIKLLIVDNIINHFLVEYQGRGALRQLRDSLRSHLTDLRRLTTIFSDLIIVLINQVERRKDIFFGDPLISLGEDVIAHAPTTRIYLRKGKGEQRIAKIIKSPYLPENEAFYTITSRGIRDA